MCVANDRVIDVWIQFYFFVGRKIISNVTHWSFPRSPLLLSPELMSLGLRTSIGLVTLGSDETLLREIDSRVLEWSKKSGLALINGEIEDYRLHKIQVSKLIFFFPDL
jgi:hypothetical protein